MEKSMNGPGKTGLPKKPQTGVGGSSSTYSTYSTLNLPSTTLSITAVSMV